MIKHNNANDLKIKPLALFDCEHMGGMNPSPDDYSVVYC